MQELLGQQVKSFGRDDSTLEVFDLFCGAGGFSVGAQAAGCRVVFACDSDEEALETHRRNHRGCTHWCTNLPRDDLPFPTDGRRFHVHGSPPCQLFSSNCTRGRTKGAYNASVNLVQWFVDTATRSAAHSWSMEEVAHKDVLCILARAQALNPRRVDFDVFKLHELGVPQSRKRLIAGSPHLIARLRCQRMLQVPRCVRDVVATPRGTHIKNSKYWVSKSKKRHRLEAKEAKYNYVKAKWSDGCYLIERLAPTVNASRNLSWVTFNGCGIIHMPLRAHELAALQTFPPSYKHTQTSFRTAMKQIGNAFPPHVAKMLMQPLREMPLELVLDEQKGHYCHSPSLRPRSDLDTSEAPSATAKVHLRVFASATRS